jgi:hypothetical protein
MFAHFGSRVIVRLRVGPEIIRKELPRQSQEALDKFATGFSCANLFYCLKEEKRPNGVNGKALHERFST